MTADMSIAPEIARLADREPANPPSSPVPPRSPGRPGSSPPDAPDAQLTLGTLARRLRLIAASPEQWWSQVRFEPGHSVAIDLEVRPGYHAWLMVLPPGDSGQPCDCDAVTMIAGEATEGTDVGAILRPGPVRVHGQPHRLRGQGTGYSISLHARVFPSES